MSKSSSDSKKTLDGKTPVNVGLIGLGRWARQAYVPILKELSEVNVVAVTARTEATRQLAKEILGSDIAVYKDYHDLLSDADVQAVFISLPNELHAQAIEEAALTDKHIFFEPPVGLDKKQIDRVLNVIDDSKRVVQADLELRYLPVIDVVRKLIEADMIGRILTAKIRLWCDWGYGGGSDEWDKSVESQGFFYWLGCWYLDVLDVIFAAPPTRVCVEGGYAMNGRLLDYGWVTMAYPNDTSGQFEFSLVAVDGVEINLHVVGTGGEVKANLQSGLCRWCQTDKLWYQQDYPASQPTHGFVGMRESVADFFNAIRSGRNAKADVQVCRRIHQAVLLCNDAEIKNLRSS